MFFCLETPYFAARCGFVYLKIYNVALTSYSINSLFVKAQTKIIRKNRYISKKNLNFKTFCSKTY